MNDALLALQEARSEGVLGFRAAVHAAVRLVPPGCVLGYGHVAALLGSPRAARQVGYALAALRQEQADPLSMDCVPWWRIIRSDGTIARQGSPVRAPLQIRLLEEEGVRVVEGRVNLGRHRWVP